MILSSSKIKKFLKLFLRFTIIFKIYNISRKTKRTIYTIYKILANLEYKDLINNFASQKIKLVILNKIKKIILK